MIPSAQSLMLSRTIRGFAVLMAVASFSGRASAQADSAARGHAAAPPPARSLVVAYEAARTRSSSVTAQIRSLLDTSTITLDRLEVHKTSLAPGASPHPPHRHSHEELMLVEQGTLEVLQGGAVRRATTGALIFEASNELHGLRNIGPDTASYWVIAIYPHDLVATSAQSREPAMQRVTR